MFLIARRNLFQEKTRLLISAGGVAFSVTLIMVLAGLYQGWSNKIGEYIRTIPADIWVMQSGSENLFHTPSILPLNNQASIEKVDGVASAKPFSARRLTSQTGGNELDLYVVAYDSVNNVGMPARIAEGKPSPSQGEIIIDRSQSKKVDIGDTIMAAKQKFKVVGFSEGGDLVTSSFAFIAKDELNKIQDLPGAANYFLVGVKPGFDANAVINNIKTNIPSVDAVTGQKFADNNTKIVKDNFLPVIFILLIIGVAVGIAVIGLTIFTATIEKSKEYGVLKAIGMKNKQLYAIVIQQALIAGVIGYALGAALAFGLGATVGQYVPQFVSDIKLFDVVSVFGLTLLMAVLAAYMPIRRLAGIDPAEVFKA